MEGPARAADDQTNQAHGASYRGVQHRYSPLPLIKAGYYWRAALSSASARILWRLHVSQHDCPSTAHPWIGVRADGRRSSGVRHSHPAALPSIPARGGAARPAGRPTRHLAHDLAGHPRSVGTLSDTSGHWRPVADGTWLCRVPCLARLPSGHLREAYGAGRNLGWRPHDGAPPPTVLQVVEVPDAQVILAPILLSEHPVGVLKVVRDAQHGPLTTVELDLLRMLLDSIALAVHNSRLYGEIAATKAFSKILSRMLAMPSSPSIPPIASPRGMPVLSVFFVPPPHPCCNNLSRRCCPPTNMPSGARRLNGEAKVCR